MRGFTLIEILIVILLIGILAVSGISGITTIDRTAKLDSAYRQIIAMINQAKGYAVNGFPVPDYIDSDHDNIYYDEITNKNEKVAANAYGVYFKTDENKALLFADYENSTKGFYDTSTLEENPNPAEGNDLILSNPYALPTNFKLQINGNADTLMYYPPLGNFKSKKGTEDNNTLIEISVCYKECDGSNPTKTIKIYKGAGLPEK